MYEDLRKQIAFENIVIETPSGDVSKKDSKYQSLIELGFTPINKPLMKGQCIHIIKKANEYEYHTYNLVIRNKEVSFWWNIYTI